MNEPLDVFSMCLRGQNAAVILGLSLEAEEQEPFRVSE